MKIYKNRGIAGTLSLSLKEEKGATMKVEIRMVFVFLVGSVRGAIKKEIKKGDLEKENKRKTLSSRSKRQTAAPPRGGASSAAAAHRARRGLAEGDRGEAQRRADPPGERGGGAAVCSSAAAAAAGARALHFRRGLTSVVGGLSSSSSSSRSISNWSLVRDLFGGRGRSGDDRSRVGVVGGRGRSGPLSSTSGFVAHAARLSLRRRAPRPPPLHHDPRRGGSSQQQRRDDARGRASGDNSCSPVALLRSGQAAPRPPDAAGSDGGLLSRWQRRAAASRGEEPGRAPVAAVPRVPSLAQTGPGRGHARPSPTAGGPPGRRAAPHGQRAVSRAAAAGKGRLAGLADAVAADRLSDGGRRGEPGGAEKGRGLARGQRPGERGPLGLGPGGEGEVGRGMRGLFDGGGSGENRAAAEEPLFVSRRR